MFDDLNEFRLSSCIKEKLENRASLKEALAQNIVPQEILCLSDICMANLYKTASHLFEMNHFQQSADAFLFLATLNPHVYEYWLGFGMSMQLSSEYEIAIDAYELASLTDLTSPVPYFYLAKCLFAIHDRNSALEALNLAIEIADDNEDFLELKSQAESARELLGRVAL